MFARLGRWTYQHPTKTVVGWLVVMFVVLGTAGFVGPSFNDALEAPDSDGGEGLDLLDQHFSGFGTGASGTIVFKVDGSTFASIDDDTVRSTMTAFFDQVVALDPGIEIDSPYEPGFGRPQVNGDRTIAFAEVNLDPEIDQTGASRLGVKMRDSRPAVDGLQVEIGGQSLAEFRPPEAELIGLGFAVVILIVSFGSVLAMGLPVAVAIGGVAIGMAFVTLISHLLSVPEFTTTIGAMIGIGVGIDYALFIVTRFRENVHHGQAGPDAAARALDTAGRAVVFAGTTVVVSLMGMLVMGMAFIVGFAVATSVVVLMTMLVSITLLPALLGYAGDRIEITQRRGIIAAALIAVGLVGVGLKLTVVAAAFPLAALVMIVGSFVPALRVPLAPRKVKPLRETNWYKFSRIIQHHPWRSALGGALVLLVVSIPVLDLRLGFSDEGNWLEETTTRRAYDLLTEAFGPGFNGPLMVVTEVDGVEGLADVAALTETLRDLPGHDGGGSLAASVSPPFPDDFGDPSAAIFQVVPHTAPQEEATYDLVGHLRDLMPELTAGTSLDPKVTGFTAVGIDFTEFMAGRTLIFFSLVLSLSFFLLMAVFRSLLVPIKAVIMNMLSISAAYGVCVAIFQWGWGAGLLGISAGAPIEPFIPMMLFAIVFGLSMDYEVFLLSRIKEEYIHTGDAQESVADGLAATARVITAAAAIMVVVFGSFLLEEDRIVKLFGTGLGVAVFLDATLVRMLLVPATMELLGERNWWIPSWLDRILPRIDVEGAEAAAHHHAALDDLEQEEPVPVG